MRLLMVGTGPFGMPTLQGLYQSGHAVVALVTGPLEDPARSPGAATPLRDIAQAHHTPILDPEDINAPESQARLAACQADLLVVCDYGQILSAETLATARLGGINLHASLLPKYRGAAPIAWAIYHGESQTGVSVIHMTPQVDAGPVIAQASTPIGPDETAAELEPRLAQLGPEVMLDAIAALEAGTARALPQDPALASKAPRLKKSDGLIDWNRPATAIKNHVRAMEPWPKTYTFWRRSKGQPLRLILGRVEVVETSPAGAAPGTVLEARGNHLVVAAARGAIALQGLQPAGKRLLRTSEFLRGYHVQPGERFGAE